MNRITQALVWLSRIAYCRGFGIQSPTDYRFVRYVINEHWPYYAYEQLDPTAPSWLVRKMGRLMLRVANYRQATHAVCSLQLAEAYGDWMQAGCRKTLLIDDGGTVQLAFVQSPAEALHLLPRTDADSVIIVSDIRSDRDAWRTLCADQAVTVSYDLYYCGILLFPQRYAAKHYKVNF